MAGDTEAFRRGLARFRTYLMMLAEARLSPALWAKVSPSDVVQQTLLQAHQHLDQFQGRTEAELAAWLRQILARALVDALRKYRSRARDVARERSIEAEAEKSSHRLERWLASEESNPGRRVMEEEDLLQLARALARLPEDQRVVVELKHLQERPIAEVAAHLGKTEAAVVGLLRRGLKRLREVMADEGGERT